MEIKKESVYTLKLEQKELDELINLLTGVEGEDGLVTETQRILNHIVEYYNK